MTVEGKLVSFGNCSHLASRTNPMPRDKSLRLS